MSGTTASRLMPSWRYLCRVTFSIVVRDPANGWIDPLGLELLRGRP